MEALWTLKTGRPPKPIEDYPRDILMVLLHYHSEMRTELMRVARRARSRGAHWTQQKTRVQGPPGSGSAAYDDRLDTGDPLADMWEGQIARGEVPDFDAPVPN